MQNQIKETLRLFIGFPDRARPFRITSFLEPDRPLKQRPLLTAFFGREPDRIRDESWLSTLKRETGSKTATFCPDCAFTISPNITQRLHSDLYAEIFAQNHYMSQRVVLVLYSAKKYDSASIHNLLIHEWIRSRFF